MRVALGEVAPAGTTLQVRIDYAGAPTPRRSRWGLIGWEELADGVIVGSAFVRVLLDHPDDPSAGLKALAALTEDLADGVRRA